MEKKDLKKRTKKYAIDVLKFLEKMPKSKAASVIEYQLAKSGTSVGANYRSACRSRSDADFASRITICEEESDECAYWFEVLEESGLVVDEDIKRLWKEADELTAIFAASAITVRKKIDNSKKKNS